MFSSNVIFVLAVISISPYCLAEHLGLQPYLNKQYELISSDDNFDQVLQVLDMSSVQRSKYVNDKTILTLTWNSKYDLYNLLVRSPLTLHEDIFKVGIICITVLPLNNWHILYTLSKFQEDTSWLILNAHNLFLL